LFGEEKDEKRNMHTRKNDRRNANHREIKKKLYTSSLLKQEITRVHACMYTCNFKHTKNVTFKLYYIYLDIRL
jgi:hypothetical protein